jgi:hypothetical protein
VDAITLIAVPSQKEETKKERIGISVSQHHAGALIAVPFHVYSCYNTDLVPFPPPPGPEKAPTIAATMRRVTMRAPADKAIDETASTTVLLSKLASGPHEAS